jgi:hypothetical protein
VKDLQKESLKVSAESVLFQLRRVENFVTIVEGEGVSKEGVKVA